MSDEFVSGHPEAAVQFLAALVRAWHFMSGDPERVMRWYNDDTHFDYEPRALVAAVRMDPNFNATSPGDIDLRLSEDLIDTLERNAAWGVEEWKDGSEIRRFVDQDLLTRAMREVESTGFEDVSVILPSIRAVDSVGFRESYNLDAIPLGVVFIFMVLVALVAIELGLRIGRRAKDTTSRDSVRPIGTVGAAVLGMMAFVIALTFGSATSRFDARKQALLEDVTAIQTAYLRASMLPEPHRSTVRSLLRDYVQARVGIVHAYDRPGILRHVEQRAKTLQTLMWAHVETMENDVAESGAGESFASALNDVINLHTKRVVLGAYYRIPGFLWWAIIFASAVAMLAVGYQFGIGGGQRIHTVKLALALTFALVMMIAFDLDRAGEGLIVVNQQPMIELYQYMSTHK
jgi:hypothetical protein